MEIPYRRVINSVRYRLPIQSYYVARRTDGKYWAGEWRWRGRTFTAVPRYVYRWGTERACRASIEANGIRDAVPVRIRYRKNRNPLDKL